MRNAELLIVTMSVQLNTTDVRLCTIERMSTISDKGGQERQKK